jgi:hypothetical protein
LKNKRAAMRLGAMTNLKESLKAELVDDVEGICLNAYIKPGSKPKYEERGDLCVTDVGQLFG